MRKYLVLAAFFLTACNTQASEQAAQDAREHAEICDIWQGEERQMMAEIDSPMHDWQGCEGDKERYQSVVDRASAEHCENFSSTNFGQSQCPAVPAFNEHDGE
jgi:hypothetical protein